MNIKYPVFLLLLLLLAACKTDPKGLPNGEVVLPAGDGRSDVLPFACDLLSEKEMLAIIGIPEAFEVLDGNRNKKNSNSTSCFYKWDDMKYDMSGVMIQINRNPLPDEIPDYVQRYMDNKRWEGEYSGSDTEVSLKYVDLEGFDFPAIYNRESYKYYFGIKNMFLCSVAFNYPAEPDQLDAWFKEIARKMVEKV